MSNDRIRDIYNRVVPVIAIAGLVFAIVAVGWSWQNSAADHRQDVQHDHDQDAATASQQHLLDCFDDFATQLAGGLPLVRAATIARDDALAEAMRTIKNAIAHVVSDGSDGSQVGAVLAALDALDRANETLADVRANNPYPPAPSVFCADAS